MLTYNKSILVRHCLWRHPWYGGSALDCWPTDQAIDPAPGAWFITKFHLILPGCLRPSITLTVQNIGLKHHSFIQNFATFVRSKTSPETTWSFAIYLSLCLMCSVIVVFPTVSHFSHGK